MFTKLLLLLSLLLLLLLLLFLFSFLNADLYLSSIAVLILPLKPLIKRLITLIT